MVCLSSCVPNMSQGGWPLKSDLVYKVCIVFNIKGKEVLCRSQKAVGFYNACLSLLADWLSRINHSTTKTKGLVICGPHSPTRCLSGLGAPPGFQYGYTVEVSYLESCLESNHCKAHFPWHQLTQFSKAKPQVSGASWHLQFSDMESSKKEKDLELDKPETQMTLIATNAGSLLGMRIQV